LQGSQQQNFYNGNIPVGQNIPQVSPNAGGLSDNKGPVGYLPQTPNVGLPSSNAVPSVGLPQTPKPPVTVTTPPLKAATVPPPSDKKVANSAADAKVNNDAETKLEEEILKSLKQQPYNSNNNDAESAAMHLEELSPQRAGSGAVFLLIVGLGMSAVMAVIVGCRIRRIGIGSRRRRKNRLDPDYLVDGMYL